MTPTSCCVSRSGEFTSPYGGINPPLRVPTDLLPNVVTIYESGQADDGTPYIAMEFLEGESLRQALSRRGALPLPEVVEILQQAARGLKAAHKLGIIHRDLKPDNIFLTYPDDGAAPPVAALPAGTADTGRHTTCPWAVALRGV